MGWWGRDIGVDGHEGEVFAMFARLRLVVVDTVTRGRLWRFTRGNVDDKGLLDHLTPGIVGIHDGDQRLLWAQHPIRVGLSVGTFAGADADGDIGSIEGPSQRIGVFEDDLVA